jgi:hypothetical protein
LPAKEAWHAALDAVGKRLKTLGEKLFQVQRRAEPTYESAKILLGQAGTIAHPAESSRIQVELGGHQYTRS